MRNAERTGRLRIFGVLGAAVLLLGACGGDADEGRATTEASASETAGGTASNDPVDADGDGAGDTGSSADDGAGTAPESSDAASGDDTGQRVASGGDADSPSSGLLLDTAADVPEELIDGLTFGELRNLMVDVHGPTDDLAAELNRVATFPVTIPTPDGADLYDFTYTVDVHPRRRNGYTTEVRFFAPGPAEELSAVYENDLVAAGFPLVKTADETRGDSTVRSLEFDVASTPEVQINGIEIELINGDFDGTLVAMEVRDAFPAGEEPAIIDRMLALDAWLGDAPIPAGGEKTRSIVQSNLNPGGFHWISHTGEWRYPEGQGEAVALAAFDLVAGSEYEFQVRDGDPDPATLYPTALEDEAGFVAYSLRREGEFNGPRMTLWDIEPDAPNALTLEFGSGSTDLLGNYTSYGL